jgi:hypothetical protein
VEGGEANSGAWGGGGDLVILSAKREKFRFHGNSCFEIFNYTETITVRKIELHCPAGGKVNNKQLKNAAFLWQLLLPN